MNRFSLLLLAAAGAPLLVHAQAARTPAAVTDPNAAVPAMQYRSVFTDQPSAAAATPDKVWVQANRDVADSPGHGGHGMQGAPAQPAPAHPTQPPAADPHQGHKDHKGHEGHDMNKKGH
jgi:hypothetical protein